MPGTNFCSIPPGALPTISGPANKFFCSLTFGIPGQPWLEELESDARAILFDLYETLITESGSRPEGVSSLAPALGCERAAFRIRWKALRPAVTVGQLRSARRFATSRPALAARPTMALCSACTKNEFV